MRSESRKTLNFLLSVAFYATGFSFLSGTPLSAQRSKHQDAKPQESFRELISVKDKAVLAALGMDHAFVCFKQEADEFLIVSFSDPQDNNWRTSEKDKDEERAFAVASIDHYEEGATAPGGVTVAVIGHWKRYSIFPGQVIFEGSSTDSNANISIDQDEFTASKTYTNVSGGQTKFRLTLRRSTGRFTETYHVTPKYGDGEEMHDDGRCTLYTHGVPSGTGKQQPIPRKKLR